MAQQIVNNGDTGLAARTKINENFTELYKHIKSYVQTFSASATFNANNGHNQEMIVTASTTISVSNEVPGTYIITLEIDSTATPAPTIAIDSSFGTAVDNNADLINEDDDINIITLVVRPNSTKYYTINTITA